MTLPEALEEIEHILGEDIAKILTEGLPNGKTPEWAFDEWLILDIASACKSLQNRFDKGLN